jgi:hypothetical protein
MENLKLVILGICAMVATALVFMAIGDIVTRPKTTEPTNVGMITDIPGNQSSEITTKLTETAQPVLLLTLPTRSITRTTTPSSSATPEPYPPPAVGSIGNSTPPPAVTSEPYPLPVVSTPEPYPLPSETVSDTEPSGPTPTTTPLATPVLGTSAIRGRILLRGTVLDDAIQLSVENQDTSTVQQITSPGGDYLVYDLIPSVRGYSILFSRDINPGFSQNLVIRWGTVRVSPVLAGDLAELPDLEIGLLGLQPIAPLPEAVVASGPITALNPFRFEWTAYPSADKYWVELRSNRFSAPVWDSGFISTTSIDFNGLLWNGSTIQPGTYWWSIGARVDERAMTISGPLWEFTLDW